jgi:hypothetical protein
MEKDGSMKLAQSQVVTVAAWTNKIGSSFLVKGPPGHLLYIFAIVDSLEARIERDHVR